MILTLKEKNQNSPVFAPSQILLVELVLFHFCFTPVFEELPGKAGLLLPSDLSLRLLY